MTQDKRSHAYVGACLIDGAGGPPLMNAAVLVDQGRVAWTGPAASLPDGDQVVHVDVSGHYLIPGLMDANVHLAGELAPEVLLRYEPGCYDDLVTEAAQVALHAGITTVFDTWGPLESLRRVRDRINQGQVVGSRILFAGTLIGMGGPWSEDMAFNAENLNPRTVEAINECWEQGVGPDLLYRPADDIRGPVRDYIAASGIDFVKYSSSSHHTPRFIAFSPDAQRVIVEEAHAAGLTAQACTQTPEALKLAMAAGVDLLQHGDITGNYPMPEEMVATIVDRQLPCAAFLRTKRYEDSLPKGMMVGSLSFDRMRIAKDENDRRLVAAGAKLLLANDMVARSSVTLSNPKYSAMMNVPDNPSFLGSSHISWLRAALEYGMSPMDALLCATRNIAEAYGKDDELGTVEPGKRADFVVLDADPLENVENYRRITHVVKDGEPVDRDRLPTVRVVTSP